MALKIILPGGLDKTSEAHLLSALRNFGAEQVTAHEWRFSQIPLSCQEFATQFRTFLPEAARELVERVKVTDSAYRNASA